MKDNRMNRRTAVAAILAASVVAALLAAPVAAADGQTLFVETFKCNQCHSVPAADIEAKITSEKMKGPDLGGKLAVDAAKIGEFLRQKIELDGAKHKKGFKGTDEELKAILDWLGSLEAK